MGLDLAHGDSVIDTLTAEFTLSVSGKSRSFAALRMTSVRVQDDKRKAKDDKRTAWGSKRTGAG